MNQALTLPAAAPAQADEIVRLPLHLVHPDPNQVRRHFDEEALQQLAASISVKGVVQPIVVRPRTDPADDGEQHYEILAGERRWRASKIAGVPDIPAVVRVGLSEEDALAIQVIENLQRADPCLADTAAGVARLDQMMGRERAAAALGMKSSWISLHVSVMELPVPVLELVQQRSIDAVETASALGLMVKEHPDHFRTKDMLALAQQGKLTRAVLREQRRFLEEEAERNRQHQEEIEKRRQQSLLPPEPRTEKSVSPAKPEAPPSSPPPADEPPAPPQEQGEASVEPPLEQAAEHTVEPAAAQIVVAPGALAALAQLLSGGEKVTATFTLGAEPGQVQCVVISVLGPEPAGLSEDGKAARMRLACPMVFKGIQATLDGDLAAYIAGKAQARIGDLQAYQAAQQKKAPPPKPASSAKPAAKKKPPAKPVKRAKPAAKKKAAPAAPNPNPAA